MRLCRVASFAPFCGRFHFGCRGQFGEGRLPVGGFELDRPAADDAVALADGRVEAGQLFSARGGLLPEDSSAICRGTGQVGWGKAKRIPDGEEHPIQSQGHNRSAGRRFRASMARIVGAVHRRFASVYLAYT